MLQEILLALAGHSSPLVSDTDRADLRLSTSERQLLASVDALSNIHQAIRLRLRDVARQHRSVICQAVANAILHTHLERFVTQIVQVERDILVKDSALVGAYDIVPLASIVGLFDEWQPRLRYLQGVVDFISAAKQHACTGAGLIDKLRADARTGFTDIESIAGELSKVAEIAWLRQLTTWLLHGTIGAFGSDDFFVQVQRRGDGHEELHQRGELLPRFVTDAAAHSIVFIGRTIRQIHATPAGAIPNHVTAQHLRLITELSLPIVTAQLDRTMTEIRASISRNVLHHLLPLHQTRLAIVSLEQYFLLRDSDFASCLIEEAERQKELQWQHMNRMVEKDPLKAMRGLSLNSSEIQQTLDRTWQRLAAMHDDDYHDELIDFARKHIALSTPKQTHSRSAKDAELERASTFDDILLPGSASLRMSIPPPLHLLLKSSDIDNYSAISSYLLATRRARIRLSDLWRRTSARRSYSRQNAADTLRTRSIWHTCCAALFFLSELTAYQNAEILTPSCKHFHAWAFSGTIQRDPEALARALYLHLEAITDALLVYSLEFTKALRSLLAALDHLTALFNRILDTQEQYRYTEAAHMPVDDVQVRKACDRVDDGLQSALHHLQDLIKDSSRYGSGKNSADYQPLVVGSLDRLLVKLQGSQMVDEDGGS